jgi:hypothetical protein
LRFGLSRFSPFRGSVIRGSVQFEVGSFSRFGHSRFGHFRASVIGGSVQFEFQSFEVWSLEVRSFDVQSFEVRSFEVRSFEVWSRFYPFYPNTRQFISTYMRTASVMTTTISYNFSVDAESILMALFNKRISIIVLFNVNSSPFF